MSAATPRFLTFDVVGTLIDFETGILEWYRPWLRRHWEKFDDEAVLAAFARAEDRLQRAHPEMPFTSMLARIHAELATEWGLETDDAEALDFRDSIRDWPAFADAVAGLRSLAQRFTLVAATNADAWAFARMNETLGEPFSDAVTCDQIGVNKPDPRVWSFLLEQLQAPPEAVLHCAQSVYHDLASAQAFGLATARIDRRHDREGSGATPPVAAAFTPDHYVRNLNELAAALASAP